MAREEIIEVEDGMAVETTVPVEADEAVTEECGAAVIDDNITVPADIPEGEMQIYDFCVTKIKSEERELQPGNAYLQEFSLLEPESKILKSEMQDFESGDGYLQEFSLPHTESNDLELGTQQLESDDTYLQELSELEPKWKKIKLEMQE